MASGGKEKIIYLWRVEDRRCITTLGGHTGNINVISFNSNGKLLASGSDDYTIRLWHI